jgi:hypothetical protein
MDFLNLKNLGNLIQLKQCALCAYVFNKKNVFLYFIKNHWFYY